MGNRVIIVGAGQGALIKSHVEAYTRSDGTLVSAHEDGRKSSVEAVPHPKGHKPGANVYFPHPQKEGKKALGKYKGTRNGKSVIEHSTGEHEVDHDHVKGASGVPKSSTRAEAEKHSAAFREDLDKLKSKKE